MYCEICRNACFSSPKSNAHNEAPFVAGSQNFQKSTIIPHEKCKDHQDATKVKERREEIKVALDNSSAVSATALYAQMGACLLLATDDHLPDTSFTTLVKSQVDCACMKELAGCDAYKKARPYRDHNIVASMQADLATICVQHTMQRIKNSAFLGIMVDESCDIAVQKKLVLYCKINHLGVAKVEFGVNTQVVNGKSDTVAAAILKFLDDNDIDIMKVTGLGTDGAPAMFGAENGVATQLKRRNPKIVTTWCVAHRLALVVYYAAQKIPYLNTIQRVLVEIYTYFQFSPVRYQKLCELKNIMQAQVKRFKKPTQVRGLSLQESVTAVLASWGVLVLALEHESPGTSVGAAQAKGILSQVKTFKFIATLHALADALTYICSCSRVFQQDVVDIVQVEDMLKSTADAVAALKDHLGEKTQELFNAVEEGGQFQGIPLDPSEGELDQIKKFAGDFGENVKQEIQRRFPEEDMEVMKDFAYVLDPRKLPNRNHPDFHDHAKESLNRLITRYGEDIGLDVEDAKGSFTQFKFFLTRYREKTLPELCKILIQDHTVTFPSFSLLAKILLTLPLTSVPCERGFSAQKRVHNSLRNALSVESINNKMQIAHEAKQEDFDEVSTIKEACKLFQSHRHRSSAKTGE